MNTELAISQPQPLALSQAMSVEEVISHQLLVKEVSTRVMQEDVHFGKIPGTAKPTLYQPGAQTLCVTFRLVPEFFPEPRELPNGHREWLVKTQLRNMAGQPVGYGYGSCSTMEEKFRYRNDRTDGEVTAHGVPKTFWQIEDPKQKLQLLRQICEDPTGNYGTSKVDASGNIIPKGEKRPGEWRIVKYPESGGAKVANENLGDCWNTVLKMAIKRSLVHAVLNTTGASDTFTQDLEDLQGSMRDIGGDAEAHRHAPEPERAPESHRNAPPGHSTANPDDNLDMGPPAVPNEWLGTWKSQVITDREGGKHYLGNLTIEQLKRAKSRWDTADMTKADVATKKLAANVELGIAALQAPVAAKEIIEKAKPEPVPADGKPEYPAEKIALLRELCSEYVMTETQYLGYSLSGGLFSNLDTTKPIVSFEDDRLDNQLSDMIDTFAMYALNWGFTKTLPVEPKKGRKKKGELL